MDAMIQRFTPLRHGLNMSELHNFAGFTWAAGAVAMCRSGEKARLECTRRMAMAASIWIPLIGGATLDFGGDKLMFQSRLTQLESDVADLKAQMGKLVNGDGDASGATFRMRLETRRYEAWSRCVTLLGSAMMILALARAFGWI